MAASASLIAAPYDLTPKVGVRKPGEPAVDPETVARMEQAVADQTAALAPILDAWIGHASALAANAPSTVQVSLLRDMAHEIRGLAGSVGHHLAGAVAGSLWTYLDECGSNPPDPDVLATFGDALRLGRTHKGPVDDPGKRVLTGLGAAVRARTQLR